MLIILVTLSFYPLCTIIDIPTFREKNIYFRANNGFFMIPIVCEAYIKLLNRF